MRRVTTSSERLGEGSPLGWLCIRENEAAPDAITGRSTSRGWHEDSFTVPRLTRCHANGRMRVVSITTMTDSLSGS